LPLPLVERSEKEIADTISKKVKAMKDVKSCDHLSVRMTGKRLYVEMNVSLDSSLRFVDAHKVALNIEREVKSIVPNARVVIHTEPYQGGAENIWALVKSTAEAVPGSRGVHNIHIQEIKGKLFVDLHLEVSANMTVEQAHDTSDVVERRVKAANPKIAEVIVHAESASDLISRELTGVETELESYIEHVARGFPEIKRVHGIEIRRAGDSLHVVLRCHFDRALTMKNAHDVSSRLEQAIRSTYPNVSRIDVHEEPD
jgi:divalent metal cation (Fe/Co/Zn/Cd) transporter